jgi:hypothetical protein
MSKYSNLKVKCQEGCFNRIFLINNNGNIPIELFNSLHDPKCNKCNSPIQFYCDNCNDKWRSFKGISVHAKAKKHKNNSVKQLKDQNSNKLVKLIDSNSLLSSNSFENFNKNFNNVKNGIFNETNNKIFDEKEFKLDYSKLIDSNSFEKLIDSNSFEKLIDSNSFEKLIDSNSFEKLIDSNSLLSSNSFENFNKNFNNVKNGMFNETNNKIFDEKEFKLDLNPFEFEIE